MGDAIREPRRLDCVGRGAENPPIRQRAEHGGGEGDVSLQVRVVGVFDDVIVEQARGAGGGDLAAAVDQDAAGVTRGDPAVGVAERLGAADRQAVVVERQPKSRRASSIRSDRSRTFPSR